MRRLSESQYRDLTAGAALITSDEHGPKVLGLPDGRMVKLFRRKRRLSSTVIWPYAQRFADASRELARRGVRAVEVEQVARVPSIRRDVVVYRRLEGETLRDVLAKRRAVEPPLSALARFLAVLHEKGVYFRAAHFGNILVNVREGDGIELSLIDLSETRFRRGSLSPTMRGRNFRPLTSYAEDFAALQSFGIDRFLREYFEAAGLSSQELRAFRIALRKVDPRFAQAAVDA